VPQPGFCPRFSFCGAVSKPWSNGWTAGCSRLIALGLAYRVSFSASLLALPAPPSADIFFSPTILAWEWRPTVRTPDAGRTLDTMADLERLKQRIPQLEGLANGAATSKAGTTN